MSTPEYIRLARRNVPLAWDQRQRLYGWLVDAGKAALVEEIRARNAFSEGVKPVVYEVLERKLNELKVESLGPELWDLRCEVESDLAHGLPGQAPPPSSAQ